MSNIYEALEQAQHEKGFLADVGRTFFTEAEQVQTYRNEGVKCYQGTNPKDMVGLALAIDQLLPDLSHKTIMVIGAQQGEGVSTVTCEMAKAAATRLGKKVLVLDADNRNPSQHLLFNVKRPLLLKRSDNEYGVAWGHSLSANLSIATFPWGGYGALSGDFSSHECLFRDLKLCFDLVVIDSSSSTLAPEQVSLARYVDGVLLVVSAEKTELSAIDTLIEEVEGYGGTIVGAVFNKKRNHIPHALSAWLSTVGRLLDGCKEEPCP